MLASPDASGEEADLPAAVLACLIRETAHLAGPGDWDTSTELCRWWLAEVPSALQRGVLHIEVRPASVITFTQAVQHFLRCPSN